MNVWLIAKMRSHVMSRRMPSPDEDLVISDEICATLLIMMREIGLKGEINNDEYDFVKFETEHIIFLAYQRHDSIVVEEFDTLFLGSSNGWTVVKEVPLADPDCFQKIVGEIWKIQRRLNYLRP